MSSIGISITAACGQCHNNYPINGLAMQARCPDCHHTVAIDWATWNDTLASVAIDGPNAVPNEDHLEAVRSATMTLVRNYVRRDATCARCKAAIPLPRALQGADHGFCVCTQCGDKISLRKVPAELARLGGITHVIGEDVAVSAGAASPRQRLFYLWHERPAAAVAAAGGAPAFAWSNIRDTVCDRAGNIYILATPNIEEGDSFAAMAEFDTERLALRSIDPQFNVRWVRASVATAEDQFDAPELSVTPSGFLILRGKDRHSALVLSCADGSTATKLGGREPPNATAHAFDLKDCDALTCDADGTILGAIHNRLLRWTYDGHPVETWPVTGIFGRHHTPQPLYRAAGSEERQAIEASAEYPPDPKEIGNHPYELDGQYGELHVGFDGMLLYREGDDLVKFDRAGTVVLRATIPPGFSREGRLQSDARGNTFILCTHERARKVIRISPAGQIDIIVDGSRPGTPAWDGETLTVLPDGTIFIFDDAGSVRVFNGDGSLRFISPKAREADQEAVRNREREAR